MHSAKRSVLQPSKLERNHGLGLRPRKGRLENIRDEIHARVPRPVLEDRRPSSRGRFRKLSRHGTRALQGGSVPLRDSTSHVLRRAAENVGCRARINFRSQDVRLCGPRETRRSELDNETACGCEQQTHG